MLQKNSTFNASFQGRTVNIPNGKNMNSSQLLHHQPIFKQVDRKHYLTDLKGGTEVKEKSRQGKY